MLVEKNAQQRYDSPKQNSLHNCTIQQMYDTPSMITDTNAPNCKCKTHVINHDSLHKCITPQNSDAYKHDSSHKCTILQRYDIPKHHH